MRVVVVFCFVRCTVEMFGEGSCEDCWCEASTQFSVLSVLDVMALGGCKHSVQNVD